MPGMLRTIRECFDRIPDPLGTRTPSLSDRLMSGLAVFPPGCRPRRGSTRRCGGGSDRNDPGSIFGTVTEPGRPALMVFPQGLHGCLVSEPYHHAGKGAGER